MTARTLIDDLARAGVHLSLGSGDRLRWSAAPGIVTPAVATALRARKAELIEALRAEARADAFEERVAIAEHDGGLKPVVASLIAVLDAIQPPIGVQAGAWLAWRDTLARTLERSLRDISRA
jgi:hypothetical protein